MPASKGPSWRSGSAPAGQGSAPQMKGAGMGSVRNGATWTPTVANLVVLLALEIAAYCALRWAFRTAHGG